MRDAIFLFYIEKILFDEGGDKMFSIDEKNNIKLTRGNSCKIDILPIITSSKIVTAGTPEILEEGDKLIFTIASPSGRKYLQKILTSDDYDENDDSVNLVLFPEDTIDLQPFDLPNLFLV